MRTTYTVTVPSGRSYNYNDGRRAAALARRTGGTLVINEGTPGWSDDGHDEARDRAAEAGYGRRYGRRY
jgi:DNA/RNA-binding domain of Phe-tRNA-synthetase-like protein